MARTDLKAYLKPNSQDHNLKKLGSGDFFEKLTVENTLLYTAGNAIPRIPQLCTCPSNAFFIHWLFHFCRIPMHALPRVIYVDSQKSGKRRKWTRLECKQIRVQANYGK